MSLEVTIGYEEDDVTHEALTKRLLGKRGREERLDHEEGAWSTREISRKVERRKGGEGRMLSLSELFG